MTHAPSADIDTPAAAYGRGPDDPPVLDMTVGDLLRRAVDMAPERAAVVEGVAGPHRRRWTYTELLRDAEAYARALLARYAPGDHVAIWAPNIPEYTVFQCGAALAGMVMVTINPTFRAAELAFSLRQSKAVVCFSYREFRGNPMLDIVHGGSSVTLPVGVAGGMIATSRPWWSGPAPGCAFRGDHRAPAPRPGRHTGVVVLAPALWCSHQRSGARTRARTPARPPQHGCGCGFRAAWHPPRPGDLSRAGFDGESASTERDPPRWHGIAARGPAPRPPPIAGRRPRLRSPPTRPVTPVLLPRTKSRRIKLQAERAPREP
jgi:AMP-binding enzyme